MLFGYLLAFALLIAGGYLMWTTAKGNTQHQLGVALAMVGAFLAGWLIGRGSR
jgi:hypothetical protein